jgi:two-component sensor histidine kinase
MALALIPVLILGAVEGWVAYGKAAQERRHVLTAVTHWAASAARDRFAQNAVLLQTAAEAPITNCQARLQQVMLRSGRFSGLARLGPGGDVQCSVGQVVEPARLSDVRSRLARGEQVVQGVLAEPNAPMAVVTGARILNASSQPDGALIGVTRAADLLRGLEPAEGEQADLALTDGAGRYLAATDPSAFPKTAHNWKADWGGQGNRLSEETDAQGQTRVYSAAPVLDGGLYLVLSTPRPGMFSWARFNLISSILLPLAAFMAALVAVWWVTERVVVRWLHYVERIAAIYAKGRFTVRPLRADRAPAEIRGLAHTLDDMADTIVARDLSLRESLAQKDAMMREIHHRVKNNLQVITSLLNMQQRSLTDPAARAAMTDTRQRISALALIYRALYQGPDLKRVDLRHFLEELLAQIISSEARHGPSVRTELDADELIIDPDKLAPLALFAVEAVTSAQKHAFAQHGGTLRVRFKVEGDDARLEIADDVPGDPDSVESAQSVGRVLMTAFARQLRGRAEFSPNLWGGSTTSLVFPTPEAPQSVDAATPNG